MSHFADRIMAMKSHTVLVTKPTQGLEKKPSASDIAAQNRLLEQAGMLRKAKAMSPMVDAFLVSADGRITTTKISMDVSDILKSVGVTLVQADGLTMLSYKLAQQYGGKDVTLDQMLKDKNFKAAYSAAK